MDCLNGGKKKSDGTCDCSTAVETLTDCRHSGGIQNQTFNNYNGSGSGSDGRPGGNSFTVQYTGNQCEIPGKLPDNFVKWFHHYYQSGAYPTPAPLEISCQVNRDCAGETTQCVQNTYYYSPDKVGCTGIGCDTNINNGTICGTNNNNLDHNCSL